MMLRQLTRPVQRAAMQRVALQSTAARSLSTYYNASHEYAKVEGSTATVGITAFAAKELGDIVYIDLPEVGDEVTKGESFGAVESVKAASDVYAPVSGTVSEVNPALSDTPNLVNESAMAKGWFIKIDMSDESELKDLLTPENYPHHE